MWPEVKGTKLAFSSGRDEGVKDILSLSSLDGSWHFIGLVGRDWQGTQMGGKMFWHLPECVLESLPEILLLAFFFKFLI